MSASEVRLQCRQAIIRRLPARFLLICLLPLAWGCFPTPGNAGDSLHARESAEAECINAPARSKTDKFNFEDSPEQEAFNRSVSGDKLIGSVRVIRYNVFNMEDPAESNRLYRLANKLNIVTWESVIRQQLLIAEGETYSPARLAESERLLRQLDFIYDARVEPWRVCGNRVDIEVRTRDIWTLTPTINFSRSGGDNSHAIGISDSNLLGSGKEITYLHESDPDRSGNTLIYRDPALFGSRWRLQLTYSDTDDGYYRNFGLVRPFFSIYETWSAGTLLNQNKFEQATWYRGDEVTEFNQEQERYRVFGGLAEATEGKRVGRWRLGGHFETNEFSYSDSNIPPSELPADRDYAYPFVSYESVEDEFIKVVNMNYLGRTEDFFTGESYHWSLGWSDENFGATRDQLVFEGNYRNIIRAREHQLWDIKTKISGFWTVDDNEFENLWWTTYTRYYHRQSDHWTLYADARFDYTDGLTEDLQVVLGGDTGLRGYDRNYQVGDRSFVVNLEERYYTDWHPFHLFRVGGAVFLDVGRAWYPDEDNGANGGVLTNVGMGLRLNSSRAQKHRMIHIDLAFPLTGGDDVDSVQILFRVRDRF